MSPDKLQVASHVMVWASDCDLVRAVVPSTLCHTVSDRVCMMVLLDLQWKYYGCLAKSALEQQLCGPDRLAAKFCSDRLATDSLAAAQVTD